MFDISPLTNVGVWYMVFLLLVAFPMIYVTKSIYMGLIPMIAFTSWLSLTGYIELWYLYVILMIAVAVFVILYIVPLVVPGRGAGG